MGYTKYDSADGEYHDRSGKSINFVSPLPIEECVSRLKRIAYSGKHKDYLHIDSITQKEYVIKSYEKAGLYGQLVEVVDGRLYVHKSGGTEVHARLIPRTGLILIGIFVMVIGTWIMSLSGPGWIAILLAFPLIIQGLLNTQANEVLDQIERLLSANSVQPSNEPPVEIPRKRDYDA